MFKVSLDWSTWLSQRTVVAVDLFQVAFHCSSKNENAKDWMSLLSDFPFTRHAKRVAVLAKLCFVQFGKFGDFFGCVERIWKVFHF